MSSIEQVLLIFAALAVIGLLAYIAYTLKQENIYLHRHIGAVQKAVTHTEDQNRHIIGYQMDLLGYNVPEESYRDPDASDPFLGDAFTMRHEPVSAPTNPSIHSIHMPATWLAGVMAGGSNPHE